MKRWLGIGLVVATLVSPVMALRSMLGPGPIADHSFPQGTVPLANLPSRAEGWAGPGEGQFVLEYKGDEKALQDAVELFAKINWPDSRIIVRDEKFAIRPPAGRVDWTLEVWSASEWPMEVRKRKALGYDRDSGVDYPAPKLTVYAPAQGINWDQVKVPEKVKVIDLRSLAKPGGVTWKGQVFDMVSAKPVVGAKIGFERRREGSTWDAIASGQTSELGALDQPELPPGSYRISIAADGYTPRTLDFDIPAGGAEQTLLISPGVTVSGLVTDDQGTPVPGLTVAVSQNSTADGARYPLAQRPTSVTDERGAFTFTGLPTGTARFSISSAGWWMLDPLKIREIPTLPMQKLVLQVSPTGSVKGTVVGQPARPGGQRMINIYPPGDLVGKWGGSMEVKPDGSFEFKNVPPGKYFLSTKFHSQDMGEDPNAIEIEVKPRQTTEATVKM